MNDHVTKPIDPDQLFSALVRWIIPGEQAKSAGRTTPAEPATAGNATSEISRKKTEAFPDELPGISIASGLKRVGGNKQLYAKLLSQFRAGQEDAVEKIRAALQGGDAETAARLAHTAKGVSGNLGAEALFRVSAALEKAIKEGDKETLDDRIEKFSSHLEVVMDGIKAFEKREPEGEEAASTAGEGTVDKQAVKALLEEMTRLLESDLTEAMNRLEALGRHLRNSAVREAFNRLEGDIEGFNTDSALKTLGDIAKGLDISL